MGGVIGVGIDVVDLISFARQLDDPASAFVDATFTAAERQDAGDRRVERLGARFAAKEAALKAWSASRFGRPPALDRIDLRELEVVCDAYGRPDLRTHGEVRRAVGGTVADEHDGVPRWLVSLSHDGPVATAQVLLLAD